MKTPLAVMVSDKHLAIRIRKVTEEKKPLRGTGFMVTAQGSSEPMTFSRDDEGVYRYDESGTLTTIPVDEIGEALIYQIPKGELTLTETVVPAGYSASEPIELKLTEGHDMDTPLDVEVVNLPLVIRIRKVTEEEKPLGGAGFTITAQGSSEPLAFSRDEDEEVKTDATDGEDEASEQSEEKKEKEDSKKNIYRYDPEGTITTIAVDGAGRGRVCAPLRGAALV